MFKLFKNKGGNKPGFSLVEIMAVLLIVALGIIGVANLAVQSIQAQTINKGNIIANQLAQEGIEIVRQVRDTNWLKERDWKTGFDTGVYCADYYLPQLRAVSAGSSCRLRIDENGWYRSTGIVSTGMTDTNYYRYLEISTATSSASVRAVVTWMERDRAHRYEAETMLYDWR